jgi:hypothetical protein
MTEQRYVDITRPRAEEYHPEDHPYPAFRYKLGYKPIMVESREDEIERGVTDEAGEFINGWQGTPLVQTGRKAALEEELATLRTRVKEIEKELRTINAAESLARREADAEEKEGRIGRPGKAEAA